MDSQLDAPGQLSRDHRRHHWLLLVQVVLHTSAKRSSNSRGLWKLHLQTTLGSLSDCLDIKPKKVIYKHGYHLLGDTSSYRNGGLSQQALFTAEDRIRFQIHSLNHSYIPHSCNYLWIKMPIIYWYLSLSKMLFKSQLPHAAATYIVSLAWNLDKSYPVPYWQI